MGDIIRELREDYPAVDVTTVVFSRDFAGVGCCVIPQDRVLAIISDVEALVNVIAGVLDAFGGYATPEMDAAITVMQQLGLDRWSMQSSMERSSINVNVPRQALASTADGGKRLK
jgi:hypothetical protein